MRMIAGHLRCKRGCPLWAISEHVQRSLSQIQSARIDGVVRQAQVDLRCARCTEPFESAHPCLMKGAYAPHCNTRLRGRSHLDRQRFQIWSSRRSHRDRRRPRAPRGFSVTGRSGRDQWQDRRSASALGRIQILRHRPGIWPVRDRGVS